LSRLLRIPRKGPETPVYSKPPRGCRLTTVIDSARQEGPREPARGRPPHARRPRGLPAGRLRAGTDDRPQGYDPRPAERLAAAHADPGGPRHRRPGRPPREHGGRRIPSRGDLGRLPRDRADRRALPAGPPDDRDP